LAAPGGQRPQDCPPLTDQPSRLAAGESTLSRIAIDHGRVYWSLDPAPASPVDPPLIKREGIGAGAPRMVLGPELLPAPQSLCGWQIDGGELYWVAELTVGSRPTRELWRLRVGEPAATRLLQDPQLGCSLALDAGAVYWLQTDGILAALPRVGDPMPTMVGALLPAAEGADDELAVDGADLVVLRRTGELWSVARAGDRPPVLLQRGLWAPFGLVVVGPGLVFHAGDALVLRARDGQLQTLATGVRGTLADDQFAYWLGDGWYRRRLDGQGVPERVLADLPQATPQRWGGAVVDGHCRALVWADGVDGTLVRVDLPASEW
jgi:hypothetical protein